MAADVKDREDRLERLEGGDPIPPMRADDHSNADPAVETPIEARQGFLDKPVLMVLIGGLALAILAWGFVELTY
ncbi:hypothetical protein DWF00_09100 [Bosea caraganae]|uniref:Uncharacterized protein n=1 Tax=Bosea caraganae TaxID=2763117 RepID=A0A370LC94_9HYPH|nr:hypothetical protein [Bosea caraganae]RDJ27148.1 hypothetical protein DWF00_09100 [Bosea caraganae]RDJ29165.1 hypothetical protein DWE98_00875 [Bosea caraganae]